MKDDHFSKKNQNEKEFLQNYNPSAYDQLSVTVDNVIFGIALEGAENYRRTDIQKLSVLLVKRMEHPDLGCWSLPGGFVRVNESLDKTSARVVENKTGLKNLYTEQLYTFGEVNRDPRTRVISCAYISLVDIVNSIPTQGEWFEVEFTGSTLGLSGSEKVEINVESLETLKGKVITPYYKAVKQNPGLDYSESVKGGLAFDHAQIILEALLRLRNKIMYTDIAFNMMPETFTINDLQQVYEAILGTTLIPTAFRRKMEGKIEETGQLTSHRGHRPSRLYRYRR